MTQKVPPETVALLRRRYVENATLAQLKAETGITSVWAIYQCLDGKYDDGTSAPLPLPKLPRRRDLLNRAESRKALLERLWRNAEQQVEQIETRLARSGIGPDNSEREARALAVLVRTLRELAAFDEADKPSAKTRKQPKPENDNPVPRDLDELRRELARRIHAFVDERSGNRVLRGPET
jgi:hypothetical protein